MYLDYSKLEFDKDGRPETPELFLKTLGGDPIGIIHGVFNLKIQVKFSEPSEISFDIPAKIDGADNPLYEAVSGYKQIYTKRYGVYETLNPSTDADGISEIKHVKGYSYEKTLESKKFFLEEGGYNFWDPASPTDTVLGRALEAAPGWKVGYVSPSLIGRYRTFDGYDDYLLPFLYNNAPEKYRCVFVFDTYEDKDGLRSINVYDADEERPTIPIYLDFDNLLNAVDIEELSDELVTALRPYGADELDIRAVNPTGSNWIYDLSYFIENGDIPAKLASKWKVWQRSILNRQMYYKGLSALQASATAQILAEKAVLTDLQGELSTLISQQSVTIQAIAMEITDAGRESQQANLDSINRRINSKKKEITDQEGVIASIEENLDEENPQSYTAQIKAIVNELSIKSYFTEKEYEELSHYFIEQDLTENTFVAASVDTSVSGSSYSINNETIRIEGSSIAEVDLTSSFGKKIYVVSGGTFSFSGSQSVSGDIIRGTLEVSSNQKYVLSFYAGTIRVNDKTASSGTITVTGDLYSMSNDIAPVTKDDVTTSEGSSINFQSRSGSMFLTANVSDYQKYSVQMELFNYAAGVLSDLATPTYEFSVESGNFIFAQEFEPFRKELRLGNGVYLNVGTGKLITPYIIEFDLDFEDHRKFSILFSNRFKRHDNVNTLKDMIESSYSTSRSFDASKYIYNQTVGQASMVSKFMEDSLDAAKNTILGAANQSVVIDGAGIHVTGGDGRQLRIVNGMIAMTDDNWEHAKLGIGYFKVANNQNYFGVNAEVIGGKLLVGNNLVIENKNDTGVMQFKVDSSGAWLYNSTFVLAQDGGGKILIDPKYGIAAGTKDLYTTSGTTVSPSFIDENGKIIF